MKHKGFYSSSRGFVFMPTSSLNNDSLKMLCPLLPTHPRQSFRAAYPKYYSNPLELPCSCVRCIIGGRGDNNGSIFCACVAASSESSVFTLVCLSCCIFCHYRMYVHAWMCEKMCLHTVLVWEHLYLCVYVILSFPTSCSCFVSITSLCVYSQRRERESESVQTRGVRFSTNVPATVAVSDNCSPFPQLTGSQIVFVVLRVAAAQFDFRLGKTEQGDYFEKYAHVCLFVCMCSKRIP